MTKGQEAVNRSQELLEKIEALATPPLPVQPEQEPVARVIDNGTPEGATEWIPFTNRVEPLKTGDLLYTTPPQRTWVGLTDEEIADCAEKMEASDPTDSFWREFFRGIEAKLKDKNT